MNPGEIVHEGAGWTISYDYGPCDGRGCTHYIVDAPDGTVTALMLYNGGVTTFDPDNELAYTFNRSTGQLQEHLLLPGHDAVTIHDIPGLDPNTDNHTLAALSYWLWHSPR